MNRILVPIKGYPNLARDLQSGNIVNTDKNAILNSKRQRDYLMSLKNKLEISQNEIQDLKKQLSEMKEVFDGMRAHYANTSGS